MKKIITLAIVFCCLLATPAAKAQNHLYYKQAHPNEISAGYGVSLLGSLVGSMVGKANFISWLTSDDDYTVIKAGGSKGILTLGYSHQLNRTISVGASLSYNRMSVELKDETGSITAASGNFITVLTTGKFDWFRTSSDIFGMYSKAGLGVMCISGEIMEEKHISGNIWTPAVQISAVGMEVGRAFSGFMELGIGMQGIVQAGVRARF